MNISSVKMFSTNKNSINQNHNSSLSFKNGSSELNKAGKEVAKKEKSLWIKFWTFLAGGPSDPPKPLYGKDDIDDLMRL